VAEVLKEATPENLLKIAKAYKVMEGTGDRLVTEALEKAKMDPAGRR
jgi:hypothetical protein